MFLADFLVQELIRLGVRHVFGVGGANIEDLFLAVQRRRPEIRAILDKHEHAAGTAADAYARVSGGLGVVMATSGGAAMNLVHSIAEAQASRVPLLAIVGEPPTNLQGQGAFQDTSGRGGSVDAAQVFRGAASFVGRLTHPEDFPRLFAQALSVAFREPGPAVLLLAKDLQRAELTTTALPVVRPPPVLPDAAAIREASALLAARPVVVIAGAESSRSRAKQELGELVELLDARVGVEPDARDAFDNRDPRFLGVTGAMGAAGVEPSLREARVVVLVGARLSHLARLGLEAILAQKPVLHIGRQPPYFAITSSLRVDGEIRETLTALVRALGGPVPKAEQARRRSEPPGSGDSRFDSRTVLAAIERMLPDDAVVLVDAGNTGANAVHHLRAPPRGDWLIAMGMAGMGYSFGAAVGAAFASGRRSVVLAGDGAFYMHGMDIHTALEHSLPISYVIFDNAAHGMCLVREQLLLGEVSGVQSFRRAHLAGFAKVFPGLPCWEAKSLEELRVAFARSLDHAGPSLVSVELADVEIPPFSAFREAARGKTRVERGART